MEFRPCIDIHDGKVKQIVGGSLTDNSGATENFVSEYDAAFFADFYRSKNLALGHVILLNKPGTDEYEDTKREALKALKTFPGGLQIGGGITAENASLFIAAGASHVIVTSYVFRDGMIDFERLDKIRSAVGREHLVLDLSCRKRNGKYYIVTDRWQKFTEEIMDCNVLDKLSEYAAEYLIHAVDVEGKQSGVDEELVDILKKSPIPVTYAGGVHSYDDLSIISERGEKKVNVTVGSALDIFGGTLEFNKVLEICSSL